MSIDTSIVLNAEPRTANGGNAAGRLRREGFAIASIVDPTTYAVC